MTALDDLVRQYIAEYDGPCPDLSLRNTLRNRLREAVKNLPTPLASKRDLAKAARDMAVLALQGNAYHRGYPDFRDAVDDVLAMTDPRNAHETAVAHGRIPAANPQLQAHISAVGDFMEELGPYLGLEDGLVRTGEFIEAAKRIRQWCHDHQRPLDFVRALKIAEGVFERYGKDQPKWWRRMDGTPILNDVAVRMAEAFRDEAQSPVKTGCEP